MKSQLLAAILAAPAIVGKWSTVVFKEFGLDLLAAADALGLSQALLDFYEITDVEAFESDEILAYRERVDMLDLMDADDPPFSVDNSLQGVGPPVTVTLAFHHANHGLALVERATEVGLHNVAYMQALGTEDPSGEDAVGFALRHFGR